MTDAGARHRLTASVAAAVVVVVVGLIEAWSDDGVLVSDQALVELRTRDVFSGDWPLLGPYSRFGWSHPGPAMFHLLAVPYRLFGGSAASLRWACTLVAAAIVALTVWVLARRSTARAGMAVIALMILLANGTAAVAEPWNPAFAVLPLLAATCLISAAADGDTVALVVAWLATIVAVESHVGIGAIVVPAVLVATVLWWRAVESRRVPVWALAVGGLLVLPVAIDTVVHWPGNLRRVARFAGSDPTPRAGFGRGVELILRASSPEFALQPGYDQFFGIVVPDQGLDWIPGLLLLLLITIAVLPSIDRRCRAAAGLHLCVAAGCVLGAASIRGDMYGYMLVFLPVYAVTGWTIVAAAATPLVLRAGHRVSHESRLAVVAVAALVVTGVAVLAGSDPYVDGQPAAAALTVRAADAITGQRAFDEPIIVTTEIDDPLLGIALLGGLLDELDRRGVAVRTTTADAIYVGGSRTADPATTPTLIVTTMASRGDATLLATIDQLSDLDRQRVLEFQSDLAAALDAAGMPEWIGSLQNENAASIPVEQLPDPTFARLQLGELSRLLEAGPQLNVFLRGPEPGTEPGTNVVTDEEPGTV